MASILLIDDDEAFRTTLGEMLRSSGHQVRIAEDGLEGAIAFRASPTDLVFVDMVMPHNGLALIQVLRSQYPAIKFIAMSGGSSHRLGYARDYGAHATLAKPFTAEQLDAAVDQTLAAASVLKT